MSMIFGLALLVVSVILIAGNIIERRRRLRRLADQDYGWYRSEHPELVTADGVKCLNCGGTRIHVRHLMQRTFLRKHFCSQCGTTLYYSHE